MTIWAFEKALLRRLGRWALLSMLIGAAMLIPGDAFWRGFGIQALAWGAVDGLLVLFGRRRLAANAAKQTSEQSLENEASRTRKILWINTGLDVLYVLGGTLVILTLGSSAAFWAGTGWGIVVQGAFLFVFDLFHARRVPRITNSPPGAAPA